MIVITTHNNSQALRARTRDRWERLAARAVSPAKLSGVASAHLRRLAREASAVAVAAARLAATVARVWRSWRSVLGHAETGLRRVRGQRYAAVQRRELAIRVRLACGKTTAARRRWGRRWQGARRRCRWCWRRTRRRTRRPRWAPAGRLAALRALDPPGAELRLGGVWIAHGRQHCHRLSQEQGQKHGCARAAAEQRGSAEADGCAVWPAAARYSKDPVH